jgi:hypothetical protein
MKSLTNSWPEAVAFFESVIGLHDAMIESVDIEQDHQRAVIVLSQVSRHSTEIGFSVAYEHLHVEMLGCSVDDPKSISKYLGYDIVDAELLPGSLWIKTLVGSLCFKFKSIGFQLP